MTQRKTIKIDKKRKSFPKYPSKKKFKLRKSLLKDTIQRIITITFIVFLFSTIFATIYTLIFLQSVSQDLPSPDKPFGQKDTATEIYDRNGEVLYRVFDRDDRDPVELESIPPLLIWSYLAAEDIRYYEHEGVDPEAIIRCGLKFLENGGVTCGGSTITQQLIRKTALTDNVDVTRKVKEMLMAMKIEKIRDKDEILEMYLTIVPSGSNIYGVTRASKFYFGKLPSELTLAEMAILSSIPQNPSVLSPTKSINPDIGPKLLESRKNYVLDQLALNLDYVNKKHQTLTEDDQVLITAEDIENARNEVLEYQDPAFRIKAPHFVFYVIDQLQRNSFNDGEFISLESIETQGLRIHTTLDMEIQRIAELQVKKAVDVYGKNFGAENAAMVVINPNNGDVLAMVGSHDYFGKPTPEDCSVGLNCKFEPQVNVVDSLEAYGSTMKPMIYYQTFMSGIATPESTIDDRPIKIGEYIPKNYDNKFSGTHTNRYMLVQSRNIPAIIYLDKIGVLNFLGMLKNWGYTTLNNPDGYGVSLAVGGGEVKLIEHAQAYSVFANSGKLTKTNVVSKITNYKGEILYESSVDSKQVADSRGIYLVNDILNGNKNGPGFSFDGRDMSGKTGTSESQKETLYIGYSPEIVVAGMLLNNDNTPMRYGATGLTSVRPWVGEFLAAISHKYSPTPFSLPAGVEVRPNGDLIIQGISKENYTTTHQYPNYINTRRRFN